MASFQGKARSLGKTFFVFLAVALCTPGRIPSTVLAASPTVMVTVSPTRQSVVVGKTQQFMAAVDGTAYSGVKWSVNKVLGGSAKVGIISSSGLYTAPAAVPVPSTVTVTATSLADTTKSASAIVTVQIALPAVTVTVSPTPQSVVVNTTQQFTATVTGNANTGVTWSVNQPPGGNGNVGTISDKGLYTAPAAVPAPNTVTVTATSVADATKSGSATVTVQAAPPPVTVMVSPNPQGVVVSTTQQFTATVTGNANTGVTWTVNQPLGENGNVGTISPTGLYTAPAAIPVPSTVTVTATSLADTTKSSSAIVTVQAVGARPLSMPISVDPLTLPPTGDKLPTSALVSVSAVGCDEKSTVDLATGGYTLGMTGVGFTFSTPSPSKCFLTSNLTIGPSAGPGTFSVILYDGKNSVGQTKFGIMDPAASPIPSGLAPQVDVMYEVLSLKVCNDVFGKRVARNFYCIEVKIGNNTGHPLQVAGIGFSNHVDKLPGNPPIIQANTSYASTRAVLLREEVLSPRNEFYHSVQALGLIMAGVQPFFVAPTASKHFAIAASIVSGPALAAISVVSPDRVVGQLNNLDDESFRDTLIVPNNTHIRTMVFVEKRALAEELQSVSNKYIQEVIQESAESQLATGNSNTAANDKLRKRISDDQKMSDQTVKNSEQKDLKGPFSFFRQGDHSPMLVKMALGNLVIVGDVIDYLQRIQVQGSTPQPGSPSSIAVTISPTAQPLIVNATQQFTATVTGTTNTAVAWSVNGIAGGNATLGTISSAGLYTAPAVIPTPNPVTVKAASAADSNQFASATVTVTTSPVTVAISPGFASVAKGGTQQFTATVTGSANTTVNWSVNCAAGGTACGSITSAGGLYAAPTAAPNPPTVTVTATSAAAPTQSAVATVTIH